MDDVLATMPSHLRLLKKVNPEGLWTPLHVLEAAMDVDGMFSHLNLVLGFGDPGDEGYDAIAATFIRFGRYGLHPVIDFLYQLYKQAMVSKVLTPDQLRVVCTHIDAVAIPMNMHIVAFRAAHVRDVYDPRPVGFLSRMLEVHRSKFAVRAVSPSLFLSG